METHEVTGHDQPVPISVVEGALEVFGDGSEFAGLPVLAFVPLVSESDCFETGLLEQMKEFARDTFRVWTGARSKRLNVM